mgnify:CR=1 FL=1
MFCFLGLFFGNLIFGGGGRKTGIVGCFLTWYIGHFCKLYYVFQVNFAVGSSFVGPLGSILSNIHQK